MDLRTEIGSLLKTATTIAAIFGAIVAIFTLTMDAPAGRNIEVAMADTGARPGPAAPQLELEAKAAQVQALR